MRSTFQSGYVSGTGNSAPALVLPEAQKTRKHDRVWTLNRALTTTKFQAVMDLEPGDLLQRSFLCAISEL